MRKSWHEKKIENTQMEIRNSLHNESRIDGIKHDSYRIAYVGKMFPFLNAVPKKKNIIIFEPKKKWEKKISFDVITTLWDKTEIIQQY